MAGSVTPGPGAGPPNRRRNPPPAKQRDPKQPPRQVRRRRVFQGAVTQLRNALIDRGIDPAAALRFAQVALAKQQGASIGKGGRIHFKGDVYNAADFAKTPLIDVITGAKARADNQKVLLDDPAYRQTLAELTLNRDQGISDLEAQRRTALIDFGDPAFVEGDPVLAAAVKANRDFSISGLLNTNYQRNQHDVQQAASRAGTVFGGGVHSGMLEAQRVFAGNQADATRTLTDLLSNVNMQKANYGQNYELGQRGALLQAQQALTAAGVLQPETPPSLRSGGFKWFKPPPPRPGGGVPAVVVGAFRRPRHHRDASLRGGDRGVTRSWLGRGRQRRRA